MAHPKFLRALSGALLVAALASPHAHADERDDARRYFMAGLEAAQAERYDEALENFLNAQALYPHPATLYNIARAYYDIGDRAKSLEYYQKYKEAEPSKAGLVQPIIDALEQLGAAEPAEVEPDTEGDSVGNATAAEIARLQAIASELAQMSQALQERAAEPEVVSSEETATSDPAGTAVELGPLPELPEGGFLTDAYERVVVTASRYGQPPLDSPSTITVLTAQDIRLSGATDIPDVLRRAVGVEVMNLAIAQSDVSIRGFNRQLANKVLVLMDGRTVSIDFLGTPLWNDLPISLAEIERIEIIRGPGSAVYGANAMTGVINIITRTPGEGENSVTARGGLPGYRYSSMVFSGRQERTSWRGSASYHELGRWEAPEEPTGEDSPLASASDDLSTAMESVRANIRLDHTFFEDVYASFAAGFSDGGSEFFTLGTLGDFYFDHRQTFARGDLSYGPLHLRAFYNGVNGSVGPWSWYEGSREGEVLNADLRADTVDVELEGNQEFTTGEITHRLSGGVGYRNKQVSWPGYFSDGTWVEHHFNVFLQEEMRVGRLGLVGSLRADRHPLVPDITKTLSPRGAAIVRVAEQTSVRLTAGTSFRSPTSMESYLNLTQPSSLEGVYVDTYGDQSLDPERVLTAELGVHDESSVYHVADVTGYINRVSSLIDLRDMTLAPSGYDATEDGFSIGNTGFTNLDSTYLGYGVELDGRIFPIDGVDIYANANIQRMVEYPGPDAESQEPITDSATSAVKLNAGAMYRTPWRTDLAAHVHYLSPQVWRLREFDANGQIVINEEEIAARTIPSARIAVRPTREEALEISANVWNIGALVGGRGFQEHPKGQHVGGRAFLDLTYTF